LFPYFFFTFPFLPFRQASAIIFFNVQFFTSLRNISVELKAPECLKGLLEAGAIPYERNSSQNATSFCCRSMCYYISQGADTPFMPAW